ncbi:hypothetical protein IM787_16365 [Ramlibacter sp. HM2]|uniref:Uncharacterized protein n=2 Tax=Ramlibacter pallidus TaxID=2780087 RepID=A0ABR9S6M8_9BURK|nr:hypothetical protein [Ramlibacter pallidus]
MSFMKTAAGHQVLKDRSAGLPQRLRMALILIDGHRSLEEVLAATANSGVTRADIERLMAMGLVADEPGDSYPVPLLTETRTTATERERYMRAYEIATRLTADVGARDLNLAVEGAASLAELEALAPRIRAAVGPVRFAPLDAALRPA